ncbi:hypothetical protein Ddye_027210 [Dipteronia dyeriana]|uniref:Uncharacterized protein n=1 Tax=Dipteronia dyeriana TaxID=168575 RepID=A0AAD9TPL4_9ROSI|nr:hypothetical protein Ddye_027210 [Dipteronia dyeriana]
MVEWRTGGGLVEWWSGGPGALAGIGLGYHFIGLVHFISLLSSLAMIGTFGDKNFHQTSPASFGGSGTQVGSLIPVRIGSKLPLARWSNSAVRAWCLMDLFVFGEDDGLLGRLQGDPEFGEAGSSCVKLYLNSLFGVRS